MTPDQESSLTQGGDCSLHWHSFDKTPDLSTLRGLQAIENVVSITAALNMETNTTVKNGRDADYVRVTTTSGAVTVTLPKARGTGRRVTLSRVAGANSVTIASQAAETVNGAASVAISASYTPRTFKDVLAGIWEEV